MSSPDKISVPLQGNSRLASVLELVNQDEELHALWEITNVTAVNRLNMTDHGVQHFQIVATNALKMLRILEKKQVKPSICSDYNLSCEYGEIVVFLAAILHDVGMSIHRQGHEEYSLFIADKILDRFLVDLPLRERVIVKSETLHAIISHRKDGQPLTLEAGIVRVADALDMSQGRSRLPYNSERIDIHSISALAVDEMNIKSSRKKDDPIRIEIVMNHTAGIFQVDELLKKKVRGSGIEQYLDIVVYMDKGKGRQLFKQFLKIRR